MNKPELLAPAGDLTRLKTAIDYGADAVYIGGQEFGLRANADNFTFEEIKKGCIYAKQHNARVYVTTNIIFHDENTQGFIEYVKQLEACGVDACIVADIYAIKIINEYTDLEIHLSTQQSVINKYSAQFFEKLGVKRIVLAREATKQDIQIISDFSDLEIETFIHGSMCIGYSGRCMLSNHMTARDANRGGCSQNCRWEYYMYLNKKKLAEEIMFTMNPDDLTLVEYLTEMCEMGITSLKIEGRMRSIYYIATIVSTYRKLIDDYYTDAFKGHDYYYRELLKAANRRISPQYFNGMPNYTQQNFNNRAEIPTKEFCGVFLEQQGPFLKIEQRNYFKKGDFLEFFGPTSENVVLEVKKMYNEMMEEIDVARHPQEIIYLESNLNLKGKYLLRKVERNEKK